MNCKQGKKTLVLNVLIVFGIFRTLLYYKIGLVLHNLDFPEKLNELIFIPYSLAVVNPLLSVVVKPLLSSGC